MESNEKPKSLEKLPLLKGAGHTQPKQRTSHHADQQTKDTGDHTEAKQDISREEVALKRHITLLDCVAIIVGKVIGSGIFISPKGVYEHAGSVGASLLVWGGMGFFTLLQTLCYAELAAVIPRAGGDYMYVFYTLGAVPAFLCVWVQLALVSASANAVISQTAGIYLLQPFGFGCETTMISCIAILVILLFTALNIRSTWFAAKIQLLFFGAKFVALSIIIITGIVMISYGHTENFENVFHGTGDIGQLSLSALDGYFAYKGWEMVNTLPEEMINPKRDLPLAVVIAMLLIVTVYVLTNIAYFAVLSPAELLGSNAIALTFTQRTIGDSVSWLIAIGVAMSCIGSVNGSLLCDPRYLFAAGRTEQVPRFFSMIHVEYMTPILAIIVVCLVSIVYGLIPSVEQLEQYASLTSQLKILTALIGLIYFRWRKPRIERPIKIPMVIILLVVIFVIVLLALSIYSNPSTTGIGLLVFVMGVPITLIANFCQRNGYGSKALDKTTAALQQLFLVVPIVSKEQEEFTLSYH